MKVRWSTNALHDLKAARAYIARNNKPAAVRIVKRIRLASLRLSEYPQSGRKGRAKETLEFVVKDTQYIIIYDIEGDMVRVLRVVHHSQQWPPRPEKKGILSFDW